MVTRSGWAGGRSGISPAALILAIVVLLATMAWLADTNFNPRPTIAPMDAKARANRAVLVELAKRCNGNIDKLQPVDRAIAEQMCGKEWAAFALKEVLKNPNPDGYTLFK